MIICDHKPIKRFLEDGSYRCTCLCAEDTIWSLERQRDLLLIVFKEADYLVKNTKLPVNSLEGAVSAYVAFTRGRLDE